MEPKRAPKVVFLLLSKYCKNLVKHRVSGTPLPPKNKPQKTFRFFVNEKCVYIIRGFVSVKLRFLSVTKRFFLYLLFVF